MTQKAFHDPSSNYSGTKKEMKVGSEVGSRKLHLFCSSGGGATVTRHKKDL
jgi:hypothetical protein